MTVDTNGRSETIRGLREFAKLARINPNLPVPAEITVEVADGDELNWFAAALAAATGEVRDETSPTKSERRVSARLYGLDVTAYHAPGVYTELAPEELDATADEIPLPPDPHDTTDLIPGDQP